MVMTFQTRFKNSRKPTQPRIRFDLEKLNDPTVMSNEKKSWVTPEILDLCDQRRDLKKKRGGPEGA